MRVPRLLAEKTRADLLRPHPFAAERVGFAFARCGTVTPDSRVVLLMDYHPVPDCDYVRDERSGARIASEAIRAAMQAVLAGPDSLFHVHLHEGEGRPELGKMDRRELPRLVSSLRAVGPNRAHGLILLSEDCWAAWVWLPGGLDPVFVDRITIMGYPIELNVSGQLATRRDQVRFTRQSFLGRHSQTAIENAAIGIVGLGGGGSHIVQQCAHLGARRFRLFDADAVDHTNLNRLVGASLVDALVDTPKTCVAQRVIRSLTPDAEILSCNKRWQECPEILCGCDIVFGCVDTFSERQQLEAFCRRYLIPYIDIGMDVFQLPGETPRMAGQVILSMPGGPCMFCLGFLTQKRLGEEAAQYGDAGDRPQVVWANGILASSAVGIAVDLLSGWTSRTDQTIYLSYDGNMGILTPHPRLRFLPDAPCPHYPFAAIGDPVFRNVLMT